MITRIFGTVTGGRLYLRADANPSASILASIPDGTLLVVTEHNDTWYAVTYGSYTGFVMKQYVTVTQPVPNWAYGQVKSNALNVRRAPSTSARRWNNVWPMNRLVLVKPYTVDGWYETLYRGESAYVMAKFIKLLDESMPESIVDRMLFMVTPELGRDNVIYFNGYSGEWCHRFADWLAMNAGMPIDMIPNDSNCGTGMVWFINNANSGGFHFKNAEHKARFISNYSAVNHLDPALTAAEEAYVPAPGDYIYFRWTNAASSVNVSHVGIVAKVTADSISTWEGNASGKVAQRTYSLQNAQIVGYGHPRYSIDCIF